MYLSIIILPLLGSIVSGFFGRKIGVSGAQFITTFSVIMTTILAVLAFFEVGLNNIPVTIELFRWIDSEWFNINWGFNFDSLTVAMLLPVLIISSLVHIYSISYMSSDPHNQRFFSYLSLFTFMMIILVTANNYLLLFVGWEGTNSCLKCLILPIQFALKPNSSNFNAFIPCSAPPLQYVSNRLFYSSELKSGDRIGPHNWDVISIIIGSLLGHSLLDKRGDFGTRIIFIQSGCTVEYLMWLHKFLATRGYCSLNKPKLIKFITKNNKVMFQYRINSYTFSNLNWLHEMFYKDNRKIIPRNLSDYLTPLALAVWFLNEPRQTISICNFRVSRADMEYLSLILKNKYNIDTSIQSNGKIGEFIHIKSSSIAVFTQIIKSHILPSLHYKLKSPEIKLSLFSGHAFSFSYAGFNSKLGRGIKMF